MPKKQPRARDAFRHAQFRKLAGTAVALSALSLAAGVVGYRVTEEMSWSEAFANAAMILSAMGPLTPPSTDAGRIFAGVYALYCGLLFIFVASLLAAPFLHALLHRFHLDVEDD